MESNLEKDTVGLDTPAEKHQEPTMSEEMHRQASRSMKVAIRPKVIVAIVTILLVAAGLYFGRGLFVAAFVNNEPIGRLEVIKQLEQRSGKEALTAMINDRLIEQEAKARNIQIDQADIDKEITNIENSLKAQNMSLETALASQNLTREDLVRQIGMRRKVEKILGDKISVSDKDIEAYMKENEIKLEKGHENEQKEAVKQQLANVKLNEEAPKLINDLMAKAHIRYFVNYK